MSAKAETGGYRSARHWIRDLLRAIRRQSGAPNALSPHQQYVYMVGPIGRARPQEAVRRRKLKKQKWIAKGKQREWGRDRRYIRGIPTAYVKWVGLPRVLICTVDICEIRKGRCPVIMILI